MHPLGQHPFTGHEGLADNCVGLWIATHLSDEFFEFIRPQIKRLGVGPRRVEELCERLGVWRHGSRLTAAASARMSTITPYPV